MTLLICLFFNLISDRRVFNRIIFTFFNYLYFLLFFPLLFFSLFVFVLQFALWVIFLSLSLNVFRLSSLLGWYYDSRVFLSTFTVWFLLFIIALLWLHYIIVLRNFSWGGKTFILGRRTISCLSLAIVSSNFTASLSCFGGFWIVFSCYVMIPSIFDRFVISILHAICGIFSILSFCSIPILIWRILCCSLFPLISLLSFFLFISQLLCSPFSFLNAFLLITKEFLVFVQFIFKFKFLFMIKL